MSSTRSLKVSLKQESLNAEFGDDIKITADVSAVKDTIVGVAGAVGVENCLKLGAGAVAGTALYMAVKSIAKQWPWVKATDVDETGVKVSVPEEKAEKFDKLMKSSFIQKQVAADFENLELKLDDILDDEEYKEYGEQILKKLKGVRIGAITAGLGDQQKDIVAAKVILGEDEAKNYNDKIAVLKADNCKDTGGGVVTGVYVAPGGKLKGENHGGNLVVAEGYSAESASQMIKSNQGDDVRVKIIGEKLTPAFERGFSPRTTVQEVINALKKERAIDGDVKIQRRDETLEPEHTLAHLESNGSTVNWRLTV